MGCLNTDQATISRCFRFHRQSWTKGEGNSGRRQIWSSSATRQKFLKLSYLLELFSWGIIISQRNDNERKGIGTMFTNYYFFVSFIRLSVSFPAFILICQFILIFLNLFMLGISVQFPDEFLKWLNTLLNTLLWKGHLAGAFSAFVTFAETSAGIKKSVHLHGKYPTVGSGLVMSSCH